jgi:iron complex outermembrane receptor protein
MPSDNNSYFYPSVSANFVVSNVLNLNKDIINYWNIRGGFFQTKIDADPYLLDWSYSSSTFGNNQATVFSGIVPDLNLKPQQTNSIELGTFAEFYNSLLTLDLTLYHSKTIDQIISSPTAASTGASIINTNVGSVSNTGIELALAATLIKNNDLYYNTGLTFAKNSNKILDLGGADYIEIGNFDGENSPSLCVKVGEQYGTIYGYDYQYINNQPVVSDDGTHYLISDTKVPIGNIAPKFQMGWTHKLKYKNISLFALLDSKFGGQIYSGSYVYGLQSGQSPETLLERDGGGLEYTSPDGTTSNSGVILNGVYTDGTENETTVHYYYKYMSNSGGDGQNISRTGIVENSYIKLRELTLSYSLPKDLITKTKFLQDISVRVTCRNVAYLYTTLPDNINPEGILSAGNVQAFEYGAMPATRTFSFGITAKF